MAINVIGAFWYAIYAMQTYFVTDTRKPKSCPGRLRCQAVSIFGFSRVREGDRCIYFIDNDLMNSARPEEGRDKGRSSEEDVASRSQHRIAEDGQY